MTFVTSWNGRPTMPQPNLRKDKAPVVRGSVSEAAIQEELNKANGTPHCPTIAQRRADSIRKQALGQIGGAL